MGDLPTSFCRIIQFASYRLYWPELKPDLFTTYVDRNEIILVSIYRYFGQMQLGKKEFRNSAGDVYVTIYFDDDAKCTVDEWTGKFDDAENFTYGLMAVLENIKEFKAKKWLADLSRIEGDFEFAKLFIAETIVPLAMRYGLQFEALVLPDNIFAMLSVQETLQKINELEICCFGTVGEAKNWLASKSPIPNSSDILTAQ